MEAKNTKTIQVSATKLKNKVLFPKRIQFNLLPIYLSLDGRGMKRRGCP
jgi:hypothetical protein